MTVKQLLSLSLEQKYKANINPFHLTPEVNQ